MTGTLMVLLRRVLYAVEILKHDDGTAPGIIQYESYVSWSKHIAHGMWSSISYWESEHGYQNPCCGFSESATIISAESSKKLAPSKSFAKEPQWAPVWRPCLREKTRSHFPSVPAGSTEPGGWNGWHPANHGGSWFFSVNTHRIHVCYIW